jgi:hypothetical protein
VILFKPEHVEPILAGRKTQTRRLWKKRRAKAGAIHQARTQLYGEPFAHLLIEAVRTERLGDMMQVDAVREGYDSTEDYLLAWERINGAKIFDMDTVVWVMDFRLSDPPRSGRERNEQEEHTTT